MAIYAQFMHSTKSLSTQNYGHDVAEEIGTNPEILTARTQERKDSIRMTASIRPDQIPEFNLQKHHARVKVPESFDLREMSRKNHIFPLKVIYRSGKKCLLLAMRNPNDQALVYDVEFKCSMPVIPVRADEIDIQWLIQKHYYGRPLSPTPSLKDQDISHDLFEQLTVTTDAQNQPDWIQNLELYKTELNETSKKDK